MIHYGVCEFATCSETWFTNPRESDRIPDEASPCQKSRAFGRRCVGGCIERRVALACCMISTTT
ncbi:hypothetical protein BGZ63DRAFT_393025 [Mariannaea sp. PMI_226]|nr:hypothetical protein BGZ63DRAFT_393025 [Mariannaea sp. PMI_226]